MPRRLLFVSLVAVAAITLVLAAWKGAPLAGAVSTATPANVDISQRHLNESEEAIAVNPTNPNNIVIVTNVGHREAGLPPGCSWASASTAARPGRRRLIVGSNDNLGDACCDPSLSFDEYGNLFMTYLYQVENTVPIALSTDGGLTFNVIANIRAAEADRHKASGDNRGLFRFVDQPTITAGEGEVWVVFNAGGPMVATGAPVTGLGQVGAFIPAEVVPGTNNCTYGDVAIGPAGQVMQVVHADRERAGRRQDLRQRRPRRARPGRVRGPRLRRRDPRRRVRLHPAAAGPLGRRRARPGLGPHRRPAHRARVPRVHARSSRTRATTPTSTCGTPTTTARPGAPAVRVERRRTDQQPVPAEDLARPDHRQPRRRLVRLARTTSAPAGLATPTASRTTTPSSGARSARNGGAIVHPQHPDQRRDLELARLRQRHRLRGLHRAVVLRRRRPSGLVGQLQQHRHQPRRRAAPTRHLHRSGTRRRKRGPSGARDNRVRRRRCRASARTVTQVGMVEREEVTALVSTQKVGGRFG